jgi:hypothetical protein
MNAAVVAWKKLNPGRKLPAAVRLKRLSGGGFSITPVKMNVSRPGPESDISSKEYRDFVRMMKRKRQKQETPKPRKRKNWGMMR